MAFLEMISDSLLAAFRILWLPPLPFPLAAGDLSSLAPLREDSPVGAWDPSLGVEST